MLRALQELGGYLVEHENRGGLRDALTLGEIDDHDTLLAIRFKQNDDNKYVYSGVAVYDLEGHREKILYLFGYYNTYDETPSSKIHRINTEDDKDSSAGAIDWIFDGWFAEEGDKEDPMIRDTLAEYENKENQIRNDVYNTWQSVDDPDTCVLTVQYEDNSGEMQFIKEFDIFRSQIENEVVEGWSKKSKSVPTTTETVDNKSYSVGTNNECNLCHDNQDEVYGFAFPFAFYTVDNARFAPNFDQSDSWQNIPLCWDCAMSLRVASNFLDQNNFSLYMGNSINYYIIPNFPLEGPVDDKVMEAIVDNPEGDQQYSFIQAEGIYERYDDPEYPLTLDFVFYTTSQSQQQVERYVRNVEPPWMREADQTLRDTYDDIYGRGDLATLDYELDDPESLKQLDRLIYNTLPGINDDSYADPEAYWPEALTLIENILKGDEVDYHRLLSMFDDELRSRFRNDENYRGYALRILLLLTFLSWLDILSQNEVTSVQSYEDVMADWGENTPEDLNRFFEEFPDAFDHPAKRAVFVEGVLAQHLMDVQSQVRSGDPPLRKQLSGLRFTTDRAREFLPRLFQDIDAYDRKSDFPVEYRDLREAAAAYFTEADAHGWSISDEEVRYYLTLGMSLNRIFKPDTEQSDDESPIPESIQ